MDTVRRLREGADVLAAAIASGGGERGVGAAPDRWRRPCRWSGSSPLRHGLLHRADRDPRRAGWARAARLDQPGPGGSLTLDTGDGLCPQSGSVCGFSVGDVAVAFDGRGHFDVLVVAAVSEPLSRVSPRAPLTYAYRAGAWVIAARQEHLLLTAQPGGASTLTRVTAAGAREPILDGVTRLRLQAWGDAVTARAARLTAFGRLRPVWPRASGQR